MSREELNSLALKLYDAGFNVIPVDSNKKPLVSSWGSNKRIQRKELEKKLGEASGIAIVGGPENPLNPIAYIMIIDVDKLSALNKYPTLSSLLMKTVRWHTGPRCPKCEAKHLEVVESGKRFKCNKCSIEFSLEECKRGIGALFFVETDAIKGSRRFGDVELLVNNYQLIPPSIHPTGVQYEWIKAPDFTSLTYGIYKLDESELKALLNELEPYREEKTEQIQEEKGIDESNLRELNDTQIIRIKELLKPGYIPEKRQHIWLYLSGWFAKSGISPYSAAKILKKLYDETGDTDDIKMRGSAIVYTYRKSGININTERLGEILGEEPYSGEGEKKELKGKSGLQEKLEESLGREEAVRIIHEIERALGIEIPNDLEETLEKLGIPLREVDSKAALIDYFLKVIDVIGEGLKHLDPEQMILLKRLGVPEQFFYDFWHNMDIEERLEVLSNNVGWLYKILSEITARIIHKIIKKLKEEMGIADEKELNEAIREVTKDITLDLKTSDRVKIVAHAINKLDLLNFVLVWYEDNSRLIGLNDKGLLVENAEDILKRYSTSIFGEWINEYVKREIKDMIKIKVIDAKEIKLNAEKYIRVNNAIIDLKTLELLEPNNDIMFFSKLDIDIEPTIIHRIREYPINELEQYFKDNPFELTFRRFYEQENWEKLRILLGTIFSDATKILIIIHGATDTLKTTLVNTVANVLGSLCMKINFRDMEKERFPFQGITYETRLVVDSEFSDIVMTKRAIELAKQLFGGDNLRIERKNRPPFYRQINTIKGLTATNKLPIFESLDEAFLSRLYLIPTHKPEDFTPNPDIRFENEVLKDKKLRKEIFYYLLYCYKLYKENPNRLYGLHDINETREILIEGSYPLKKWESSDRIIKDENAKEKLIDLWNDFIEWRKTLPSNDEDFDKMNQISSEKFKRLLESRYQKIIHGGRIWFKGIGLKNKQNTLTS